MFPGTLTKQLRLFALDLESRALTITNIGRREMLNRFGLQV